MSALLFSFSQAGITTARKNVKIIMFPRFVKDCGGMVEAAGIEPAGTALKKSRQGFFETNRITVKLRVNRSTSYAPEKRPRPLPGAEVN